MVFLLFIESYSIIKYRNKIKILQEVKTEIKIENLKDFLLKLTQKDIEELMKRTEKEEDRIFYNKLFNLILETKQEELIKKGVF